MISLDNLRDAVEGRIDGIDAPVKGLNTQAPLRGLTNEFAIVLDNWICQPDSIVTRLGCQNHVTGFANPPKSFIAYNSGTTAKLFAVSSDGIFDVTTAGAVGATVRALTNGQGVHVNFATSAGQYAYFVNGADSACFYDGTSWAISAITGPALTSLSAVETYRQRLFFLQNNFLGFYYLAADSIAGAATAFRIGSLCRKGGYAVAMGTWSLDGGSGPDDNFVVATSEGEILIWRGSDPGVVANWVYQGTYYVGKPVGPNCFAKSGGDLLYLCDQGLIPMSTLPVSTTRNYASAITNRIQPTISNATALYGALPGWKIHLSPKRSLLMINAPVSSSGSAIQFVYNTYSTGWSTFSGWNAADFIEFGGATYFTAGTSVVKAFTGYADYGSSITALCDTSYNRFRTRTQVQPVLTRAVFASSGNVGYTLGFAQDYSGEYTEGFFAGSGGSPGLWDSGLWDTALWATSFDLRRDWVTIPAKSAISLSTRFRIESKDAATVLLGVDYKLADQGLLF